MVELVVELIGEAVSVPPLNGLTLITHLHMSALKMVLMALFLIDLVQAWTYHHRVLKYFGLKMHSFLLVVSLHVCILTLITKGVLRLLPLQAQESVGAGMVLLIFGVKRYNPLNRHSSRLFLPKMRPLLPISDSIVIDVLRE